MHIQSKSFGECLNDWFHVLVRRWKPLLLSSLFAFLPLAVAVFIVFLLSGFHSTFADLIDTETLDTLTDEEVLDLLSPLIWVGSVWALLQIVATVFVSLASTRIVAEDLAATESSTSHITAFAWSKMLRGLGAALLLALGMALILGTVFGVGWIMFSAMEANFWTVFTITVLALTAVVVIVWIGLSMCLYAQVVSCEDIGAVGSLRRSFDLVQSRWWPTAGFVLLAGLIVSAASQILGVVLVPVFLLGLAKPVFLALGYALSLVLYGPLTAALGAGSAIWYVDLRARKEPLSAEQLV